LETPIQYLAWILGLIASILAILSFVFNKHSLKDLIGSIKQSPWLVVALLVAALGAYLWMKKPALGIAESTGGAELAPSALESQLSEGGPPSSNNPDVPYQVDSHTVALWHFNETSGTKVLDETGGHVGIVHGVPMTTAGLFGNSRVLGGEGSGSYITVTDGGNLDGFSQVTVELWIRPVSGAANMDIVAKGQHTGNAPDQVVFPYELSTSPTSPGFPSGLGYSFFVGTVTRGGIEADSSAIYPFNEWLYVAGTYDGRRARIYVNGQLEGESRTMEGMVWTNDDPLFINNLQYPSQSGMIQSNGGIAGTFDEVRISNIARSADEIAAIYRTAKARKGTANP
jgi:Concanavalin A-like lectin/glucanases superfamily